MSNYVLFDKEVSFSKAADRYFYILKAFEFAVDGASNAFKSYYDGAGNISDVLDGYADALAAITKSWATESLYATLKDAEIYDVSDENFESYCWDLESAAPYYDCIAQKYNEIANDLADAKQYRALRKASRSKYGWMSSTEWADMTNAAMTAGALNAMSGIGHSIRNGVGNLASSISAASSKKALYNDEKTFLILDEGIRECMKNIYLRYMAFVNEYKEQEGEEIWYDGSVYDSEKADTLLKNAGEASGKEKELLFRAFSVCPYHYDVSATIFLKYEEERKNIFEIAKKYKNDLTPLLDAVIESIYTEQAQKSECAAQEAKEKIKKILYEYNIEDNATLNRLELDCLGRIISGEFEYDEETLECFRKYDALTKNKKCFIKAALVWQLSKEFDVEFDGDDVEHLIEKAWNNVAKKDADTCESIKNKIRETINAICLADSYSLESSKVFCEIERVQLELLCAGYESYHDTDECEALIRSIVDFDALDCNKDLFIAKVREKIESIEAAERENEQCIHIFNTQMLNMCVWELEDFVQRIQKSTLEQCQKQEFLAAIEDRKSKVPSLLKSTADILQMLCNAICTKYGLADNFLVLGNQSFQKKFPNAESAYGGLYKEEIALILQDQTLFGNAKNGFILTNKRLFTKPLLEKRCVSDICDIESVEAESKNVYAKCLERKILISAEASPNDALVHAQCLQALLDVIKDTTLERIEAELKNIEFQSSPVTSTASSTVAEVSHQVPSKVRQSKKPSAGENDRSEMPLSQQIAALLKKYDCGTSRTAALTGTAAFSKKIGKARESYAAFEESETPLLLRDTTFFGSGKEGFVLTDKALYVCSLGKSGRFPLNCELSFEANYSMKLYHINFLPHNDLSVSTTFTEAESNVELSLWKELIALLSPMETSSSTSVASEQKDTYWVCTCGNKSFGKFCSNCGKKKEISTWICDCGAINSGKFCHECGSPKKEEI